MRISKTLLVATSTLAAMTIALTGCTTVNVAPAPATSHQMTGMGDDTSMGDAVMFAQMMIPHHMQAITMAAYAKENAKNADVVKLAKQIYTEQAAEIETMKTWLGDAKVPSNAMSNGMLSDTEMKALAAAKGADFDKLFLAGMKSHHEGALTMAAAFQKTTDPELKKLVTSVLQVQTIEIAMIKLIQNK